MKHVIIVNGKPRAGKDTLIALMREMVPCASHEFSSIDPVRRMLNKHVDLSRKTEADRKLLATVGDAMEAHSGFRTAACLDEVSLFFMARRAGLFFCHIREPHHIATLSRAWRLQGIKVTTVLLRSIRAEDVQSNPADAGVEKMRYDRTIENNGTLVDLRDAARAFLVDLDLLSPLT